MHTIADQIVNAPTNYEAQTIEKVKMTLLDTVSAIIIGMHEQEMVTLISEIQSWDKGNYSVIGAKETFSLTDAAFVMGTASVAVELDEGNQWSKGHPSVHILPIFIIHAMSEDTYNGKQFIVDFINSYEACTYFGKITTLKSDLHAHGTWGVLGSAATLGIIHKANYEKMKQLLNLAATFATPTQWSAALEGAQIRNVYIGESIVGGLRAWQLVNASFKAPMDNAERIFGSILGEKFDLQISYNENLPAIENSYFKLHAFCRYVHVPLEVFESIVRINNIDIPSIASVVVKTYERAATLQSKNPENSLSSKFSIPFALATWAFTGRTDHGIFTEKLYELNDIKELAKRITVIHNPIFDENYPNDMPAEVEVTLNTGEIFVTRQDYALGGPNEKLNFAALVSKFKTNTHHILTEKAQNEMIHFINTLEEQTSMNQIIEIVNNGLKEVI